MKGNSFTLYQKQFQKKIRCYCPCHVDPNNSFAFTMGLHCDQCYDKRVKK